MLSEYELGNLLFFFGAFFSSERAHTHIEYSHRKTFISDIFFCPFQSPTPATHQPTWQCIIRACAVYIGFNWLDHHSEDYNKITC